MPSTTNHPVDADPTIPTTRRFRLVDVHAGANPAPGVDVDVPVADDLTPFFILQDDQGRDILSLGLFEGKLQVGCWPDGEEWRVPVEMRPPSEDENPTTTWAVTAIDADLDYSYRGQYTQP